MSINRFPVVNRGERGRYAVVILAVLTLTYFTENFLRSAPSALSPILIDELGLSYGMAGVLFSSYFFLYALMQVPSGILSGVLGPRRTIVTFTRITVAGTSSSTRPRTSGSSSSRSSSSASAPASSISTR